MEVLSKLPCGYVAVGLLWSAYQGVRGAVEQRVNTNINGYATHLKPWERWVVLYVHDFAFRFVCTAAGFVALYAAQAVLPEVAKMRDLSAGALAFVGLAFLVGIVGVGGQLHYLILLGKWPKG